MGLGGKAKFEKIANINTEASPLAEWNKIRRTLVEYFYCKNELCKKLMREPNSYCCTYCSIENRKKSFSLRHSAICVFNDMEIAKELK